jgi:hypothetical protein
VRQNVVCLCSSKFKGAELVRKIETGLECGQWLLREMINTPDRPCWACTQCEHSVSHSSRQPPIPPTLFESRYDFPDRVNTLRLMQRTKTFRAANQRHSDYFLGGSPLLMLCMSKVFLIDLDNHRPHSSPVSIFQTDSTPLDLCKGLKDSAAPIGLIRVLQFSWPVSSPHALHQHSVSHVSQLFLMYLYIGFVILDLNLAKIRQVLA